MIGHCFREDGFVQAFAEVEVDELICLLCILDLDQGDRFADLIT